MNYRYIEFTDYTAKHYSQRKSGIIWYVGEPSEELINEIGLIEKNIPGGSRKGFYTTISSLGENGWELKFVTPCGVNWLKNDSIAGPIENSYIFQKQVTSE